MLFGRKPHPTTVSLWLTVTFVLLAVYVYWINVLWTVLLVICVSLFVGLLTLSLISEVAETDDVGKDFDQTRAKLSPPSSGTREPEL